MKKNTYILITAAILAICATIIFTNKEDVKYNSVSSTKKIQVDYFQNHKSELYLESEIPATGKDSANKQEQLTNLYGVPVTNDLGIPDHYLDLIDQYIPESNVNARKAAVKMFYYDSLAMQATNQKEILSNIYKWSAGFGCVYIYSPDTAHSFAMKIVEFQKSGKIKYLDAKISNNISGHVINDDYGISGRDTQENHCKYYITH